MKKIKSVELIDYPPTEWPTDQGGSVQTSILLVILSFQETHAEGYCGKNEDRDVSQSDFPWAVKCDLTKDTDMVSVMDDT